MTSFPFHKTPATNEFDLIRKFELKTGSYRVVSKQGEDTHISWVRVTDPDPRSLMTALDTREIKYYEDIKYPENVLSMAKVS